MDDFTRLQHVKNIDSLTGLLNHSRLQREIRALVDGATPKEPVGLLMVNIVNFAAFNETYGFDAGDELLRRTARALREFQPEAPAIGRYGSDLFVLAWQAENADGARLFVSRVARKLAEVRFCYGAGKVPVSMGLGYALAPIDAPLRGDLIAICAHRCELSREQAGTPVGSDEAPAMEPYGSFSGIETIVDGLLNHDPWTRLHLLHVNGLAKEWSAFNLDFDEAAVGKFLQASLLHDVGKLLVSDRILLKPSTLTPAEYRAIQQHARFGQDILERYDRYQSVAAIVGQHHERWDGQGYPHGLSREHIDPIARAIAVLDAYSAMVVDRSYHCGISERDALEELELCAGTQFDPFYVERFVQYRRDRMRRKYGDRDDDDTEEVTRYSSNL
ncbi:MAG TPA: HD domain-containing phosphohydrolase [Candidatus Baltobacteraceae bacterium]|nr:HD domain-containing phosphohydrolase [Candidatus Baltobacteraceae bacterium]